MIAVDARQIDEVKEMLRDALSMLKQKDDDLFFLPQEACVYEDIPTKEELERKLHEVCINHKLACYIEELLKVNKPFYFIDIEYNRYYRHAKYVEIDGDTKPVRPDILIHTRAKKIDNIPQHYIVIETKKDECSLGDQSKVKAFIKDPRYEYLFGVTINYNNLNPINCKIFYSLNGQDIDSYDLII